MFRPKRAMVVVLVVGLLVSAPLVQAQEAESSATESTQAQREAMYYRYLEFASYVKGGSIEPHWMADGSSFWYAEGAPANTVIYKVDPNTNTKEPLFDAARLRQALTPVLGHKPPYQGLPFDKFTFVDGEKAVKFAVEGKEFVLQLDTYAITRAPALSKEEKNRLVPQIVQKSFPRTWPDLMEVLSPDRRWFASLKEHNLWLRSTYDGRRVQLTTDDGTKDYEWRGQWGGRWAWWSPDSFKLAFKRVDTRKVRKVPIVHYLNPPEEVEWFHRALPGGPIPQTELFIVDILSKRLVRIDTGEEPDQHIYILGWRPDGSELLFVRVDRTRKKLDLMAANPTSGATHLIFTEAEKTFIGMHLYRAFTPLGDGKKFIWLSEMDRWLHLYLYDLDGTLIRRLTQGAFPVVRVIAVDEKLGWVYFTAHGDQQRPYDTHLYRVNLDGKKFTRLTEGTGQHRIIQFAPSREFFLDTHSSIERPPAVDLRRADGTLLQTLSRANIDALQELQWNPPEEFVVKAADGKADLYGLLFKPYDFDLNKKYPVIEFIYAGPTDGVVPHTFSPNLRGLSAQALAQLGFITFIVDGRGTGQRGKEFYDVAYGNLGRHEIPDHVAALKQLAAKRPYMDLSRVGIHGSSWGGWMTVRAMLLAPDVYHVGIAKNSGADLYDQGARGVEPYMGLPQNNQEGYEYASNARLASNLKGKLLILHGTSDINSPFSETMRLVEAFIRADKPYDLLVFPEQNHRITGTSLTYMREAIRRYFQEHLKPQ